MLSDTSGVAEDPEKRKEGWKSQVRVLIVLHTGAPGHKRAVYPVKGLICTKGSEAPGDIWVT
jgi:hypothetical protein